MHRDWGKGVAREVQNGRLVVVFEREGEKTIAIDHVLANGLPQRADEAARKSRSA